MKKILNKPADYVDEMLEGLCLAHPELYTQPERRVITRAVLKSQPYIAWRLSTDPLEEEIQIADNQRHLAGIPAGEISKTPTTLKSKVVYSSVS